MMSYPKIPNQRKQEYRKLSTYFQLLGNFNQNSVWKQLDLYLTFSMELFFYWPYYPLFFCKCCIDSNKYLHEVLIKLQSSIGYFFMCVLLHVHDTWLYIIQTLFYHLSHCYSNLVYAKLIFFFVACRGNSSVTLP